MPQPKLFTCQTNDNSLSLVPKTGTQAKSRFKANLNANGCALPKEVCAKKHPMGCHEAYLHARGLAYQYLKVNDPRFSGPRSCTVDEAFWYLANDPASDFCPDNDGPSFYDAVAIYTEFCREQGVFGPKPPAQKSVTHKWLNLLKAGKVKIEKLGTQPPAYNKLNKEPDRIKVDEPAKETGEVGQTFKAVVESPYMSPSIPENELGVDIDEITAKNKTAKESENIRWVANMMPLKSMHIDIGKAPSSAAVGLLQWARENQDKFYNQFYVKILPTQKEFERESAMKDSGGELELLKGFLDGYADEG